MGVPGGVSAVATMDVAFRAAGRSQLRVTGVDATPYLHRMLSQDIAGLRAGGAAWACLLDPKARLLALLLVHKLPDALILECDEDVADATRAQLERTVLMDDVQFEDVSTGFSKTTFVGPRAAAVLAPVADAHPHAVFRWSWRGADLHEVLLPVDATAALVSVLRGDEIPGLEAAAWDAWRVDHALPAWGAELTSQVMPLEAGLGGIAISFSKGCYPGQEPVAKARHIGRPPSRLVRLGLVEGEMAEAGAALLEGGQTRGRVTTVKDAGFDGEARALGYVRTGFADPGSVLQAKGGKLRVLAD